MSRYTATIRLYTTLIGGIARPTYSATAPHDSLVHCRCMPREYVGYAVSESVALTSALQCIRDMCDSGGAHPGPAIRYEAVVVTVTRTQELTASLVDIEPATVPGLVAASYSLAQGRPGPMGQLRFSGPGGERVVEDR